MLLSQYDCKQHNNSKMNQQTIDSSVKSVTYKIINDLPNNSNHLVSDSIINSWLERGGNNKDSLLQMLYESGQVNRYYYYDHVSVQKQYEIKTKLFGPDWIYSTSNIQLNRNDFNIGILSLDIPFDSIKLKLGKPDSIKNDSESSGALAFYYPKLVVWVNNYNHHITAFDIYDTKFITFRGLKIGDSLSTALKLYPREMFHDTSAFHRSGPYDDSFKEYSQWRAYIYDLNEEEGWLLAVFSKNNLIVKLLFYVSVGC
jgi:hypothetical protein